MEVIWDSGDDYQVVALKEDTFLMNSSSLAEDTKLLEQTLLSMENMKKRYDYENELLHAFSLELTHKALSMRATFNEVAHKSRLSDSLRK